MPGSKRMVKIPSFRDDTWLLMTCSGPTVLLRDFVSGSKEIARWTEGDADFSRHMPHIEYEKPERKRYSKVRWDSVVFWRARIELLNLRDPELDYTLDGKISLQSYFKIDCKQFLRGNKFSELEEVFKDWITSFESSIKDKPKELSRSDKEDIPGGDDWNSGTCWQRHMLQNSRKGGEPHWIGTGHKLADFSLLAMEVQFGIRAVNNPRKTGVTKIIPDGIGIRRDGHFTVVEVKAPGDIVRSLNEPLLQATCGALATYAKRNMLRRLARTAYKDRIAYRDADIPEEERSIGIHLVLYKRDVNGKVHPPMTEEIRENCRTILKAVKQLRYIAWSFHDVHDMDKANPFADLKTEKPIES